MGESNAPVIHVSGAFSLKDYTTAVRAGGIRYFLKLAIAYIILLFLVQMGTSFYYWYPALKDGYVTCAEWLSEAWKTVFSDPLVTYVSAGFILLCALYLIIIGPIQVAKRWRELHPDGLLVTYDFFDDHLVTGSATQTADQTFRLKYSDVRRKIGKPGT